MEVTNSQQIRSDRLRVYEALQMEVRDTAEEDEDHPPKKKCNNAKWFSEKALQIAERRRGAKAKIYPSER